MMPINRTESAAVRRAADRGERIRARPVEWLTATHGFRLWNWQLAEVWRRADRAGLNASQVLRELLCRVLTAPASADGARVELQPPTGAACYTREQRQANAAGQPRDARGRFTRA